MRTWPPGEISRQQQKGPDPDLDLIWRTVSLGAICGRLLVEKQFAERGKVCAVRVSRRRVPIRSIDHAVDEVFVLVQAHAAVAAALLHTTTATTIAIAPDYNSVPSLPTRYSLSPGGIILELDRRTDPLSFSPLPLRNDA